MINDESHRQKQASDVLFLKHNSFPSNVMIFLSSCAWLAPAQCRRARSCVFCAPLLFVSSRRHQAVSIQQFSLDFR